ncbi:MAG: nucleoside-triphosphatase [Endomicrobiia bacterium]
MENKIKNYFITGLPKIGKTTLAKKIIDVYKNIIVGFYTEEILKNNSRIGFKIINSNNESSIFALKHGENIDVYNGTIKHYKKYDIFIDNLEKVGIDYIEQQFNDNNKLFLIDEVGSMEMLSERFCNLVVKLLNSDKKVILTLRANTNTFIEDIKKISFSKIIVLQRNTFDKVYNELISWIEEIKNGR